MSAPLVLHEAGTRGRPRIVALHGLTDSGSTWPDLIERYRRDWDITTVDLRGHGDSPRFTPDELTDTPSVMLADVLGVLDAQPEAVVLIGHSLGGNLALHAALARPEKVRALVLEDPAKAEFSVPPDPDFATANLRMIDAVAADLAGEVARMRRETPWSGAEVAAWAESKLQVDRDYVSRGLALAPTGWEELFNALIVPTLLVIPPDAPMAPRREEVSNPQVRFAVVPEAGHCVRRDQPEAFYRLLDSFLAEGEPGGPNAP